LVGLGAPDNTTAFSDGFEIIDLGSNISSCPEFPDFPFKLSYAYGGLGYRNEPIICGGMDDSHSIHRDCFKYIGGNWIWTTPTRWMANYYEWGSFTFNPGVNFINVLSTNFLYKCCFSSFF